jgi:hypothetical protein
MSPLDTPLAGGGSGRERPRHSGAAPVRQAGRRSGDVACGGAPAASLKRCGNDAIPGKEPQAFPPQPKESDSGSRARFCQLRMSAGNNSTVPRLHIKGQHCSQTTVPCQYVFSHGSRGCRRPHPSDEIPLAASTRRFCPPQPALHAPRQAQPAHWTYRGQGLGSLTRSY